jgi:hypothetical protein
MDNSTGRREALIAGLAIGAGFFVLPFAIYLVGRQVFGPYGRGDGNVIDLAESIWGDLLGLHLSAWVLVLSPYVFLQMIRLLRRLWRSRVTAVTESGADR